MNFTEIAENRQSCRKYDPALDVENEKIVRILESARLVITLGYAASDDTLRVKKRKTTDELITYMV